MYKKIFIATTNSGKVNEIKNKLNTLGFDFSTKKDFPDILEPVEDGETFYDNALIKAKYYFEKTKIPSLADDSGLIVEFLNGEPGVYSARYAGDNATDSNNIKKLLDKLINVNNRRAYFYCSLVFYADDNLLITGEGRVDGLIIDTPKGNNGFGYDPVFYLESFRKTMAELTTEEKNQISHRAKALEVLYEKLQNYFVKKL